eukprot:UN09422
MRLLSPEETRVFFEKLAKYIGRSIKHLLDSKGGKFCFRIHQDRIFYLRKDMVGFAKAVERKKLMSAGICFGKFQRRTRNVRLHITSLEYLSQYAQYKVWIKPKAEMSFIYGNHVLKAQVLRITENAPQYHGVIVYNQQDTALGFGSMARSTSDSRKLDPTGIMVFNQADVGEYLRAESQLFAQ